jgi:hypothetical protein
VVALNFFFDTLLFCGAILLLANSIDKMKKKVGTLLIAIAKSQTDPIRCHAFA